MIKVAVGANRLSDIPALEAALEGKFLYAEVKGGKAEVTLLPVASLDFFINVWNCQGDLYLAHGGKCTLADDVLEMDTRAVQTLINRVVCDDNEGGINMSGQYFPQSEESVAMFRAILDNAVVMLRGAV